MEYKENFKFMKFWNEEEKGILREQVIQGRKEIYGKRETQGKYGISVKQGSMGR